MLLFSGDGFISSDGFSSTEGFCSIFGFCSILGFCSIFGFCSIDGFSSINVSLSVDGFSVCVGGTIVLISPFEALLLLLLFISSLFSVLLLLSFPILESFSLLELLPLPIIIPPLQIGLYIFIVCPFIHPKYFLNITLDFLNNRCIICAYDEYGGI